MRVRAAHRVPVPSRIPKDEEKLIKPTVEGTLRALRATAISGTVRGVVMTSSIAREDYDVGTERVSG